MAEIKRYLYMQIKSGKYRHFKGNIYEVIGTACHSETLEEFVVYKPLYKESLCIRPKKMFLENVLVDGKEIPRFEFIE